MIYMQFSLRTLAIGIVVIAAVCCVVGYELRLVNPDRAFERSVAERVAKFGGTVHWEEPVASMRLFSSKNDVRWIAGVSIVASNRQGFNVPTADLLVDVCRLRRLRALEVDLNGMRGFAVPKGCTAPKSAKVIAISNADWSTEEVLRFLGRTRRIKSLFITGNREFDPRELSALDLSELELLNLSSTKLSDDCGMREVCALPALRELSVDNCAVTDKSVAIVLESRIKILHLRYSEITSQGIAKMEAAGVGIVK